jgi:hypothetical protein
MAGAQLEEDGCLRVVEAAVGYDYQNHLTYVVAMTAGPDYSVLPSQNPDFVMVLPS